MLEVDPKDIIRFVNKIHKTNGCWEWAACLNKQGYGRFNLKNYNGDAAHRISYELFVGEIPYGLTIDHLCKNTKCVNPAHLEVVTMKENCLRGLSPPSLNARKEKCPYGHKYEGKNNRGDRVCMICKRYAGARDRERCRILGIDRNRYKKKAKKLT